MASLTTLRSNLSTLLRDPNNRVRPLTTIDSAINNAQTHLQAEFQDMIDDATTTITTVAGQQEYNLPADFAKLIIATFEWQELYRTTLQELKASYSTFSNGTSSHYYIRPGVIGLYPIPDRAWALYMLYSPYFPTITTSQDSTAPSVLDDALLYKAAANCFRQVGRIDMANIYEIEYTKEVNKALVTLVRDLNLSMSNMRMPVYWQDNLK